ncbi:MAG: hypothetical protein R3C17_08885 [Planctomycetaceae bacterium]
MHGPDAPLLSSHLFAPIFYIPWGRSDVQALVLLDDLDAVQSLTAQLDSTVEELSIGFCPKFTPRNPESKLVSLHSLYDPSEGKEFDTSDDPEAKRNTPFQEAMPLLVYAKLKFDALCQVGFGLLFQECAYEVIQSTIARTLQRLRDDLPTVECGCGYMQASDIDNVSVAIIDLQGPEELGVMVFCSNYSVGMTVIADMRQLTYSSLFAAGECGVLFNEAVNSSNLFSWLTKIHASLGKSTQLDGIRDNHIFRWTRTSLAVSPFAMFEKTSRSRKNCHGVMAARTELQIPPGHNRMAERSAYQCTISEAMLCEYHKKHIVQIPVGDIDLESEPVRDSASSLVTTGAVIDRAHSLREKFGLKGTPERGRNVIDWRTFVSIPIMVADSSADSEAESRHCPLFTEALPEVQRRLFESSSSTSIPSDGKLSRRSRLDRVLLHERMRTYGVPPVLRRTIECLFQDFSMLLGDYLAFDCVIDLYDAFASLHATLTEHLPRVRARELGTRWQSTVPLLDASRIEHLSRYVGALKIALDHRMAHALKDSSYRDMEIELRGGLNQIIAAADVPLKCGLGLLRQFTPRPLASERRETVGGITAISIMPGMTSFPLDLGVESHCQLCFIEADVAHVLHVGSFCDYLHEAAHLIFFNLGSGVEQRGMEGFARPDNPRTQISVGHEVNKAIEDRRVERIDEVFAYLFVRIMLFRESEVRPDRSREFLIHHLISNSKSRSGRSGSADEMITQVSELLCRLCLADYVVPKNVQASRWPHIEHPFKPLTAIECQNVIEAAIESCRKAIPESSRLWDNPESPGWQFCIGHFIEMYGELAPELPRLWRLAMSVFEAYMKSTESGAFADFSKHDATISTIVRESTMSGVPLSRLKTTTVEGRDRDANAIDCLMLVCAVLSGYLSREGFGPDCELFLHRDRETGKVVFPKHVRSWSTFLVDVGGVAMFCSDPASRGTRLSQQVASLKTLWDIATQLRARRFCEIVHDNWL